MGPHPWVRQWAVLRRGSDGGKQSVLAVRPLKFGKGALSDKTSYLSIVLSLLQVINHVGALATYGLLMALGVSQLGAVPGLLQVYSCEKPAV